MERINGIKKLTDNRFLNLYEQDAVFRDGSRAPTMLHPAAKVWIN